MNTNISVTAILFVNLSFLLARHHHYMIIWLFWLFGSVTYITCPADQNKTLAIKLPFLILVIKNMKKYFTFEVQVSVFGTRHLSAIFILRETYIGSSFSRVVYSTILM